MLLLHKLILLLLHSKFVTVTIRVLLHLVIFVTVTLLLLLQNLFLLLLQIFCYTKLLLPLRDRFCQRLPVVIIMPASFLECSFAPEICSGEIICITTCVKVAFQL